MTLEIIVATPYGEDTLESDHVDALRRAGVPMRSWCIFQGVDIGKLEWEDTNELRRYRWSREEHIEEHSKGLLRGIFRRKHRISRQENLASIWYIVEEWNWYWPIWSKWTHAVGVDTIYVTRFKSLYEARRAVQFQENRNDPPVSTIVERL